MRSARGEAGFKRGSTRQRCGCASSKGCNGVLDVRPGGGERLCHHIGRSKPPQPPPSSATTCPNIDGPSAPISTTTTTALDRPPLARAPPIAQMPGGLSLTSFTPSPVASCLPRKPSNSSVNARSRYPPTLCFSFLCEFCMRCSPPAQAACVRASGGPTGTRAACLRTQVAVAFARVGERAGAKQWVGGRKWASRW